MTTRERRILLVAGVAAGMAAVFRTPLGAALLAVEVLYRDDFESDALIPAVLASVVAYSVVISLFGESTLFAHAPRYPFSPRTCRSTALLAVVVLAASAIAFLGDARCVQRLIARLPVPAWCKPAVGGLALGRRCATPIILIVGAAPARPGQGLGILGGGYGAAQLAITGARWFPGGWRGGRAALAPRRRKLVATSLTIGSGGSAGDFAPSLVIGGIFGGAFGRAAQILFARPAHRSRRVRARRHGHVLRRHRARAASRAGVVCELAGSYDLLVPLMLAEGIAFVALRQRVALPRAGADASATRRRTMSRRRARDHPRRRR